MFRFGQKIRRWLSMDSPLLVLGWVNHEVRYMVRQGTRILVQGACSAPEAFDAGHLKTPAALARALIPLLPKSKGRVALLLPTEILQLHELNLPNGLDEEELSYQITRYMTHTLALNPATVFYDWSIQVQDADKRVMTVLLAIAQQMDVVPFHDVFIDTDWQFSWASPEPQVWALAYGDLALEQHPIAVCQIETGHVSLWLIHVDGHVQSFFNTLDEDTFRQAGFVYQSATDAQSSASVQLPTRFVADLLEQKLPEWLGQNTLSSLNRMYVTGKGVNWHELNPLLQSRLGLPLRLSEEDFAANRLSQQLVQPDNGMAALWYLSKQVNA